MQLVAALDQVDTARSRMVVAVDIAQGLTTNQVSKWTLLRPRGHARQPTYSRPHLHTTSRRYQLSQTQSCRICFGRPPGRSDSHCGRRMAVVGTEKYVSLRLLKHT